MKLTIPIMNRSMQIRTALSAMVLALAVLLAAMLLPQASNAQSAGSYPVVDTGQDTCYDDSGVITCPTESDPFYGQDAQFIGNTPSYTDNGDGTITDNVTDLIWQQSADTDGDGDIDAADKMSFANAGPYCENLVYAGNDDWQLPTIKQLYSLIDFEGKDPSGYEGADTSGLVPFIDTDYFDFAYGDTNANERIIDSQYASSTLYVSGAGEQLLFGVNFADGRIKGYGLSLFGRDKTFSVACVRANDSYGVNDFSDTGDATITDSATGLMWAQNDSGSSAPDGLNWEEALAWVTAQNEANYLGYSDWRLPNVKELQSIVNYSRSPDTTDSAAIDPLFNASAITNEAGQTDYAFYWSSTTHANWTDTPGSAGAYVSFGRAMGYMDGAWSDVHGAGAQRSDPKSGDPDDYPTGNGPQGDAIRIYNYARLVRDVDAAETPALATTIYLPVISNAATDDTPVDEPDESEVASPLVDTGQGTCYDNSELIDCPAAGEAFYGQDAQYTGNTPSYTDNGDPSTGSGQAGSITDNVTGLVWTQNLSDASMPWSDASDYCESLTVGSVTDWRLPNVKELWSIRDFSTGWPWVDTDYFYLVGDGSQGAQQHSWSSNYYLVDTEEAVENVAFIVNDWTGHIKALDGNRFVRCVSGDEYGINDFENNGDSTITDNATGLMWAQNDSGTAMDWGTALAYAEDATDAGYDDWRLPNVKELQSIADYSGVFPAIDSTMFDVSEITNEAGNADYPYYWTGTSNPYIDPNDEDGYWYAWYVASGYAVDTQGNDTHGAGAVRFDTKSEDGANGPDGERYYNYVRLVRGGDVVETPDGDPSAYRTDRVVVFEDGDTGDVGNGAGGPQDGSGDSQMPDMAAVAEQLGVTEEALITALGDPSQGAPDFEAAAAALGITAEELENALMSSSTAPADAAQPAEQPADADNQSPASGGQEDGPGGQQMIDLATVAAQLGVTEEALQAALGDPSQGPPDLAAAAQTLGVTESKLIDALGPPADGPQIDDLQTGDTENPLATPTSSPATPELTVVQPDTGSEMPAPPAQMNATGDTTAQSAPNNMQAPDLAAAAAQLGVTEEVLQAALGDPNQGPPDFAAAAQTLGVTEEALMAALGLPANDMPMGSQPNGQPPMGRQ